ncbi:Beta-hexosaminidase [bioreactor metagenome]|uniref:Beta-hexosaminidase n=1 Tax=bioreactor metagenome TaxID=1076179 RepID=A0A645BCV9_9ZZZZ
MEAARRINGSVLSYAEAACAALNAGCDMVLLCNQSVGDGKIVDDFLADMQQALEKGQWQADENSEARRVALLPETLPQPWDELMIQPAYMHALDLLP